MGSGVVDQNVDAAESFERCGDDFSAIIWLRDITTNGQQLLHAAEFADERRKRGEGLFRGDPLQRAGGHSSIGTNPLFAQGL
jgi:hypothetical protein